MQVAVSIKRGGVYEIGYIPADEIKIDHEEEYLYLRVFPCYGEIREETVVFERCIKHCVYPDSNKNCEETKHEAHKELVTVTADLYPGMTHVYFIKDRRKPSNLATTRFTVSMGNRPECKITRTEDTFVEAK